MREGWRDYVLAVKVDKQGYGSWLNTVFENVSQLSKELCSQVLSNVISVD